jgi:hypothetical protein
MSTSDEVLCILEKVMCVIPVSESEVQQLIATRKLSESEVLELIQISKEAATLISIGTEEDEKRLTAKANRAKELMGKAGLL